MTETANVQLNNLISLPYAQAYIKIPTGLKHLPCGAKIVGGLIYSFSGVQDEDGIYSTICRTRKAMKESLHLSLSTLSRRIAELTEKGYISRLSRDEYIFNRDKLKSPGEFTRIELSEIAEIMNGYSRMQGIRLLVFSWFNARCNNDKKKCGDPETEKLRKAHKVAASYADIAENVGCSDRQAIRVVNWLLKHNYIHRPKEDKGTSISAKSVYTLDRAYWRRKKRNETKPADVPAEPEPTPEQKAVAARQLWLERVKAKAFAEAERNTERAQRNKRYKEAHKHVVGLDIEIAFKELSNPETVAKLEAERAHWLSEETAALKALGLSAKLLDENYLFERYSAGGAPPGGSDFVGVDEQNKK